MSKKPQFTKAEESLIIDSLKEDEFKVIMDKSQKAQVVKLKTAAWEKIAQLINARNPDVVRTGEEIRKKWGNLKGDGKEKNAEIKKAHNTTGNATDVKPPTEIQAAIMDMLGDTPSFKGNYCRVRAALQVYGGVLADRTEFSSA